MRCRLCNISQAKLYSRARCLAPMPTTLAMTSVARSTILLSTVTRVVATTAAMVAATIGVVALGSLITVSFGR